MEMQRLPFNAHNALWAWQWSPFSILVLIGCIASITWYLRADWSLAARGRRWPPLRTVCFVSGIISIDLALQSPIASFTGTYFQAHVLQHLILMMVAPALCALGAPMTLILQTSGRRAKVAWLKVFHSKAFIVLAHPVTVFFLYYGVMIGFFLSPLLGWAMEHMWAMDLLNLFFLFGATLFWWPIVGIDPIPRWNMTYPFRMVLLLIGVPLESFLAIAILSATVTIAPMYTLAGTHAGGGYLWAMAEMLTVIAIIPIYFQWMSSEDRKQARSDARLDARRQKALTTGNAHPDDNGPVVITEGPYKGWTEYEPYATRYQQ
jgi:cytochrome c oxidase assembly factor CtaG